MRLAMFAAALGLLTACSDPPASAHLVVTPVSANPGATPFAPDDPVLAEPGYSRTAVDLTSVYTEAGGQPVGASDKVVASPDGASTATVRYLEVDDQEGRIRIDVAGAIGTGSFAYAAGPNMEMMWAPDSKALFFTENDGGLVGGYDLYVVGPDRGRLSSRKVSDVVARAYQPPGRCFDPERPNVAGLVWKDGSKRLLALAETPPHSNCDAMGTFSVMEIDLASMTVARQYSQIEAKARFGPLLGARPRAANDACFGPDPTVCFIPQLHPELKGAR